MTITTVAEFAKELKKSPDTLLEQLKAAGVAKSSAADALTDADKQKLLGFLKASHGTDTPERKKITLVKKSTSEIKQADATGKARTIQVEVRKKRTFVKRDENDSTETPEEEPTPSAAPAPILDQAELARREEEARRQAEFIRRQEEELVEKRRLREAQEAKEREAQAAAAAPAADTDADKAAEIAAKAQAAAAEREAVAKASAEEDAVRAKDLDSRRRTALAEAEAIRTMMNAPKKVLVAKKPPEPEKAATPDPKAIKGTLHKPAAGSTAPGARPAGAATTTKEGQKEVKSAKLSSSWADEQAKKKEIKTRGDASGGVGRNSWRGGPRGKRERDRVDMPVQAAPVEARIIEV
ncbi:MAG: translation initiation factor IF-2, partial [Betaproteobacteria bacterium]|nr:translation initiation factor IF-2 [Betaproteobacteria bacterium]